MLSRPAFKSGNTNIFKKENQNELSIFIKAEETSLWPQTCPNILFALFWPNGWRRNKQMLPFVVSVIKMLWSLYTIFVLDKWNVRYWWSLTRWRSSSAHSHLRPQQEQLQVTGAEYKRPPVWRAIITRIFASGTSGQKVKHDWNQDAEFLNV